MKVTFNAPRGLKNIPAPKKHFVFWLIAKRLSPEIVYYQNLIILIF